MVAVTAAGEAEAEAEAVAAEAGEEEVRNVPLCVVISLSTNHTIPPS